MKSKHLMLIMVLGVVTILGCKKPVLEKQQENKEKDNIMALGNYSNWPNVTDGRLVFQDKEHFADYLNYLDESIMCLDSTLRDDTTFISDADVILAEVEDHYNNFTSIREVAFNAFESLNETGWSGTDDIPDIHFIHDISFRSVFNQDLDIQIDDHVIHFVNEKYIVAFPANDANLFNEVHNLPLNATIHDITALVGSDNLVVMPYREAELTATVPQAKLTAEDYRLSNPSASQPDKCNNPKKIKLSGLNIMNVTNPANSYMDAADFEIIWDLNNYAQIQYISSTSSTPNIDVDHTYSTAGSYIVRVNAKPAGSGGGYTMYVDFPVFAENSGFCNYKNSNWLGKQWHNIVINNVPKVAWTGESEVFQGQHWFSTVYRVMATTERYEWNGSWKHKKGNDPSAEVWCDIYNSNCNYQFQKFAWDYPGGAKTAHVNSGLGGYFGWTSMKSTHRIKYNNQFYWFDRYLYSYCQ